MHHHPSPQRARRNASIAATSLAVLLASSHGARGQNAQAEALFVDGDRLMTEGQIAQACDAFDASNRIEPRAGTLIRLGECREQNGQIASAWSAYKDALSRAKDPYKIELASKKVAELEPRLSYMTVVVEGPPRELAIRRNGSAFDNLLWNRALPVDGGDYGIAASAPDHDGWETTVKVAPEKAKVVVRVPKLTYHPRPRTERPPTPYFTLTLNRKVAIGVAGASAVALATGIVLGVRGDARERDAYRLCPDPATPCTDAARANRLVRSGHRLAFQADIAFALAAEAAIGAGLLWYFGKPQEHTTVVPAIDRDGASVTVQRRF